MKKNYPKYKCTHTFTIESGRYGSFAVNKGEVWELRDSVNILLAKDKIGIRIYPWQFTECFIELKGEQE